MNLDYALPYDYQRLNFVEQNINLTDPKLNLEYICNYILYGKQPTPTKEEEYEQISPETIPCSTRYTAPRPRIPWEHPELQQLHQSKLQLNQLIQKQTNPQTIAFLKRWNRELSADAAPILQAYNPTTTFLPTYTTPPTLEIDDFIDYTNSFHIKHLITYYSQLRQSETSKWNIYYLDRIIEKTPITDWQKYMLKRRIDGISANIIGFEIAEKYHKFISTTYMSTIMRTIYKQIAETALQLQQEYMDRQKPQMWKECGSCKTKLHINKFNCKKKYCKLCEKKRREAITSGTNRSKFAAG